MKVLWFLVSLSCFTNAYDILILTPHALGPSHKKGILPVAKGLAKSGHNVVYWSPSVNEADLLSSLPPNMEDKISLVDPSQSNFLLNFASSDPEKSFGAMIWKMKGTSTHGLIIPWYLNCEVCELVLRNNRSELDAILSYRKWDLAIVDTLFAPCSYLAVEQLKIPYIAWSTSLIFVTTAKAFGMPVLPGVYPLSFNLADVDIQRFLDRLWSSWNTLLFTPVLKIMEWLTRRSLLGQFDHFSFNTFEGKASLAVAQFSNRLDWPTALLSNVEIFGSQCGPTGNPLPPDILEFVEDPKSLGTVFIAFGHGIKWSLAPAQSIEAFTSALKRLSDYRVIWQSDLEPNLTSSSSHILARKWLPQVDILNHPKTKVFISHTGAKSLLESICAGVPLVAMPQYAEQYRNTAIVNYRKIGRFLDKFTLTSDTVYDTIREVLNNPHYLKNTVKMKGFFDDNIIPPTDYAVFQLERSVRRTKALELFRNKGSEMTHFVYFSFDIILSVLACTGAILYGFVLICKCLMPRHKRKID